MAVAALRYITEDEYLSLEETAELKHEYLAGRIFDMAGGSAEHALVSANVIAELRRAAGEGPCRVFSSDLRIRVQSSGLNTYPDVSVVCGALQLTERKPKACTNPAVLVEVLSESTQEYDRGEKWRHYQTIESLQDYLLVWQDRPRVERYSRLPDGGWRYELAEGLEAQVTVLALEGKISLAQVYRGVEFPPAPALRPDYAGDGQP